jgi:hypothetical protein
VVRPADPRTLIERRGVRLWRTCGSTIPRGSTREAREPCGVGGSPASQSSRAGAPFVRVDGHSGAPTGVMRSVPPWSSPPRGTMTSLGGLGYRGDPTRTVPGPVGHRRSIVSGAASCPWRHLRTLDAGQRGLPRRASPHIHKSVGRRAGLVPHGSWVALLPTCKGQSGHVRKRRVGATRSDPGTREPREPKPPGQSREQPPALCDGQGTPRGQAKTRKTGDPGPCLGLPSSQALAPSEHPMSCAHSERPGPVLQATFSRPLLASICRTGRK